MVQREGLEKPAVLLVKRCVSASWAGWGPEKSHELIQLPLRASKDTSVLREKGTKARLQGPGHAGRPSCREAGGAGSPPSCLRDQLIVHDLKKKSIGGGEGGSRNYRTARTDTQGMAGITTPYKTQQQKTQPTHLRGQLIYKLKGGISPPGGTRSSAKLTARLVLPGSNEKLVNS